MPPDLEGRTQILARGLRDALDQDLVKELAGRTAGFTGYDQAALSLYLSIYLSLSLSLFLSLIFFLICLGLVPFQLIIRLSFPTLRFRPDLI